VIPIALPDGAIGPSEFVTTEELRRLSDLLGVDTYRIRTEFSGSFGEPGYEEHVVVEVDVKEHRPQDSVSVHERWFSWDPTTGEQVPAGELIASDGRRFAYDPRDDEWEDIGFPQDLVGPVLIPAYTYASLDEYAGWLSMQGWLGQLTDSWLGNEKIDGRPVGHYEIPPFPDDIPGVEVVDGGYDWDDHTEFWIDATGIVWRYKQVIYVDGVLWTAQDTTLYDVGADITIEVPIH
jgi:hypothetical protein